MAPEAETPESGLWHSLSAADARLRDARALKAAEASLTGESPPVDKHVEVRPRETPFADCANMIQTGNSP